MFKRINNVSDEQFVGEANVIAPFTTIQNRAKVEANCKVVGPVERIVVNSLKLIGNEFGPNGENIYTSDNEDSRIRFYGAWDVDFNVNGMYPAGQLGIGSSTTEITYYGTGINLVTLATGAQRDIAFYVDGVLISSDIYGVAKSSVIGSRGNKTLQRISCLQGQTEGWHTARFVQNSASVNFNMYGFEIVNESNNLKVLSGSVIKNGYEYILDSDVLLNKKPAEYTGNNGARCLVYLDNQSIPRQAIRETGTPLYGINADHSNEAVYRILNHREIGRNRADDFSTLADVISDRAFTLDDGCTTLIGENVDVNSSEEGLTLSSIGSFIIFAFKGSGIDIYNEFNSSGMDIEITVNGVLQVSGAGALPNIGWNKIASGLPSGTNIIKIERIDSVSSSPRIIDFRLYRNRKPIVPKELPILADYDIVADYAVNLGNSPDFISKGVNQVSCMRSCIYTGNWTVTSPDFNRTSGFEIRGNDAGDTLTYSFYGKGFIWKFANSSGSQQIISVDGSTDFSTKTTSITTPNGFVTFDDATGLVDATAGGAGLEGNLEISGFDDGWHEIVITNVNASNVSHHGFDIIQEMCFPHTTFGFNSLGDMRSQSKHTQDEAFFNATNELAYTTKGISQLYVTGLGSIMIFFEEAYLDGEKRRYPNVISGAEINFISNNSQRKNNTVMQINTRNDAGGGVDSVTNWVSVTGTKQKDIFKD